MGVDIREARSGDTAGLGWTTSPDSVRRLLRRAAAGEVVFLVAADGDRLVGQLVVDLTARPGAALLTMAAVDGDRQGRGIGTRLFRAAERVAADRGFPAVELEVEDNNPRARALYERLGYRVVRRLLIEYDHGPVHVAEPGVTMRRAVVRDGSGGGWGGTA